MIYFAARFISQFCLMGYGCVFLVQFSLEFVNEFCRELLLLARAQILVV